MDYFPAPFRPLVSLVKYTLVLIGCALFCHSVAQDPFFWDTVQLGSKHAHFFYENGLQFLPLPEFIDSGHPPFFGYYLACCWAVFGKSLEVGHWAMLPFLLISGCMLLHIGSKLSQHQWTYYLLPIVWLDPVVFGQQVMVSPDVWIISWFLMAVGGLLSQQKYLILFGIMGLCLTSMRGMMTAGALFLPLVWMAFRTKHLSAIFWAFFPGFALGLGFLAWHWAQTGWIGFHENSPWSGAFQAANWSGMAKNFAVIGWRWLDFGRVFEWIILVILAARVVGTYKGQALAIVVARAKVGLHPYLLATLVSLLIFLSYAAIRYQNLSAHRYFLPVFLMFHIWIFYTISNAAISDALRKRLFIWVIVGLGTGNFWVYPTGIAMGWDSTAAHLPYHGLRAKAIDYLESQHADFQYVGSTFPNLNTGENLHLNGDMRSFVPKDFKRNQYMFVSNVFNDFSASEINLLRREWILGFRDEHAGVWVEVFIRKK